MHVCVMYNSVANYDLFHKMICVCSQIWPRIFPYRSHSTNHNFNLEDPIPTIQQFFCSLQRALSYGTLNSNIYIDSILAIFPDCTVD